jgi:multiple sugar transport system permease protein
VRSGRPILSLRAGLALLAPVLALVAVFLVLPAIWVITIAFTNEQLLGPHATTFSFVGLANFQRLFDLRSWLLPGQFGWSLRLTLIFVAACVAGQAGLGLAIAWLFHRRRGWLRELLFSLIIVAWITPEVAVTFAWFAFYNPDSGTFNAVLHALHLPKTDWLVDRPMLAVIVFNIWRGTAFSLLLFSGALASLPHSYLEAASVIGANGWQAFRHVILPLLKIHVLTDLLLITLSTFNTFTPFLLTGGGPAAKSDLVPIYVWRTAFEFFDLGKGASVALVMIGVNLIVALFYLAALRSQPR